MTSIAQVRTLDMSVPSQSYYLINRVERLELTFYSGKVNHPLCLSIVVLCTYLFISICVYYYFCHYWNYYLSLLLLQMTLFFLLSLLLNSLINSFLIVLLITSLLSLWSLLLLLCLLSLLSSHRNNFLDIFELLFL